jgi:hypothetical protein
MLTPFYSHSILLYVSTRKGASSGSADKFHETGQQMLVILIFMSGHVFCGPVSLNVSVLPENDPLRAETCSSVNRVVLTHISALVGFLSTIN